MPLRIPSVDKYQVRAFEPGTAIPPIIFRAGASAASTVCLVIRHGTAMALLQAGVDIAVIAVWLGHESIETTDVYVHLALHGSSRSDTLAAYDKTRRFSRQRRC